MNDMSISQAPTTYQQQLDNIKEYTLQLAISGPLAGAVVPFMYSMSQEGNWSPSALTANCTMALILFGGIAADAVNELYKTSKKLEEKVKE